MLNVGHIVAAVLHVLQQPNLSPVTIGVYGDWGSGKSSVLRMLRDELEKDSGVLCVYFNGWLFEGYEDAKAALMSTILDQVRDERGALTKAKDVFNRLVERVDWLRVGKGAVALSAAAITGGVTTAVGLGAILVTQASETSADDLEKVVKEKAEQSHKLHQSVRDFTKDFAELLKKTEIQRLVVIVDDLDRCTPDRVIETLEAIRLFLSVESAAFIIGADEELVRKAISMRYEEREGGTLDVGRHYLEKMVQVPVRVQPLAPSDVIGYLNLLFAESHLDLPSLEDLCGKVCGKGFGVNEPVFTLGSAEKLLGHPPAEGLKKDLELVSQIGGVLADSVEGNPRQVKRFLNALVLRLRMAEARGLVGFERRIAAKLLLLEYFRSESWFRTLNKWQAAQNGRPAELELLEERINAESGALSGGSGAKSGHSKKAEPASSGRRRPRSVQSQTDNGADEELPPLGNELTAWLSDPWARQWLATEPSLKGIDLRPYFYFARQRPALGLGPEQRLTRSEREVFDQILSPSHATRLSALGRIAGLTPAEANSVFAALLQRSERSEDFEADNSPLTMTFQVTERRPELGGQLVTFLRSLSVSRLRPGMAMRLASATRSTAAANDASQILSTWRDQEVNPSLASAAENALERMAAPAARTPSKPQP